METRKGTSAGTLVENLTQRFGDGFDPGRAESLRVPLKELLGDGWPGVGKREAAHAVDEAIRVTKFPVDWSKWICSLLSFLPGSWQKLNSDPGFAASTMFLLTDGTVMCQEQGGLRWKRLTPDATGSYINGTWSDLAPMHHTRRYYASAVLADGRVFVCGGEYSDAGSETNTGEIYDPVMDTWTEIGSPAGWTQVGDAACAVLPDGRVLVGNLNSTSTAIFDPSTDAWTAGPTKGSSSSEETWVLLPDETVVTVRCNSSQRADKYVAASNSWADGGTLPTGIVEIASSEIGPGVLMNDGRALFAGANGHTALYSMPALASDPGSWAMGPDFPNDPKGQTVGCKDTPASLMTNGRVLIAAGPVDGIRNDFLSPTYFFEFDGVSLRRVADPPNAAGVPYIGRMLLLPTGQILFAAQTDEVYAYNYFGCADEAARPEITSAPSTVRPLWTYTLQGRLLNGLSQAVGYGDDAAAATNYPIVRIRHLASGTVTYCRTRDHSTMGVGTGAIVQSTNFSVPWGTPSGESEICVIANGIASEGRCINVKSFIIWPFYEAFSHLIGSFADGPLWVLGPHGPIPVDPWGPEVESAAAKSRKVLVAELQTLRRLGDKVHAARLSAAAKVPLADDFSGEEVEEEAHS